tara:strand:+ start:217 stop:675 length:459 start_codon:yes stop_codon:yes gene_type:complete
LAIETPFCYVVEPTRCPSAEESDVIIGAAYVDCAAPSPPCVDTSTKCKKSKCKTAKQCKKTQCKKQCKTTCGLCEPLPPWAPPSPPSPLSPPLDDPCSVLIDIDCKKAGIKIKKCKTGTKKQKKKCKSKCKKDKKKKKSKCQKSCCELGFPV